MGELKRPRTPGLRIALSEGEKVWITHIPTDYTIEQIVKKIDKPESVTLEFRGRMYYDKPTLKNGEDLELAKELTIRIHHFRSSDKICLQYIGPREIYKILRYKLVEEDSEKA